MAMRAGTETGSLMNHLMTGPTTVEPAVGMGVTLCGWTDRYAGTITKVSPSGKTITIVEDIATRTDKNGRSENQTYDYKPDPNGRELVARKGKRGWKVARHGYGVTLGVRMAYYDHSY